MDVIQGGPPAPVASYTGWRWGCRLVRGTRNFSVMMCNITHTAVICTVVVVLMIVELCPVQVKIARFRFRRLFEMCMAFQCSCR